MRQLVTYHELWLVSERDESARFVKFNPRKNLLAGANETGKSRILKHLVWALGGEPSTRIAGNWDVNIAASVALSVGQNRFTFLRIGRDQRAAFNAEGRLLLATENAQTWAKFFAKTFEFPLKLQRHQEGAFALAGPEYALLPFYIDQEGGWARKWGNFLRLSQFARWEPVVFESFLGLRPQRYFDAQLTRDELVFRLRELRLQAKVQATAYQHVKAMLPKSDATLDENAFAKELNEVASQVETLVGDENEVRNELFKIAQERHELTGQLQLAARAEQDLVEDLAYLSKYPDDEQLNCPTCGQAHGLSFRAKVELATDANDAHQLYLSIRNQLDKLSKREEGLRNKLASVTRQMETLRASTDRQPGTGGIAEIVAAKSLATIEDAYGQTRQQLAESIDELDENRSALQAELDALTNAERVKEVRAFYKAAVKSYADRLDIAKEEIASVKIGARPAMGAGSSGPRVYLAMHMAMLETNAKYGSGLRFPFIVDTPRQQGLDDFNTGRLLSAVYNHAEAEQIFIANESVPTDWTPPQDCTVQTFTEKRRFLREEEYRAGVEQLAPMVGVMREAITAERQLAAEVDADSEAVEEVGHDNTDGLEEDED
jgi:DNA repair exonuclease SbcCD ATPase subunit